MEEEAVVEKREVVVAEVPVAFRKVKFWRVEEALSKRLEKVAEPDDKTAAERLLEEAVVEKKLVVVAEVPVAFLKVKFWRVEEPETNKSPEELIVVEAVPPTERVEPVKTLAK